MHSREMRKHHNAMHSREMGKYRISLECIATHRTDMCGFFRGKHHSKAKSRGEHETTVVINLEHKSLDILNSFDLFEVDACHCYAVNRAEFEAGYFLLNRQVSMDTQ